MTARVLILEDEVILAMDLADQLEAAGFEVVGPATSVAAALRLMQKTPCDAAVLDINLGTETSEAVAEVLTQAGTPYVVLSGNSRAHQPAVFHSAPWVSKPFRGADLLAVLSRSLQAPAAAKPM